MADKKRNNILQIHRSSDASSKTDRIYGTFPEKVPMAEQIKKYRKAAKISQQSLADQMNVTRNSVINWESGKYRPDADLFPKLCNILGITMTDLFGLQPSRNDLFSVHEQNLIHQYRMISPVSQRIVDRMIGSILEEEIREKHQMINDAALGVAVIATKAAAGDGFEYNDIPIEDYRFVFANGKNEKADAIIQVKGDSMLPVYHEDEWVYVQYTEAVDVGEDVICSSRAGMHIKRMGEEGPYSVNKNAPFTLTAEDDHVRIVGRVLGIVNPMTDLPSTADMDVLTELRRDEIREFREEHGLD
ncbi:MAG TPA: hypothetical protein DCG37_03320 [Lachnospiraceae bacterium]|nr:hypothetical protein [Lachnospiraceae bacterium]